VIALLPTLNALLNALSAFFLALGFFFIKRGRVPAHRAAMGAALASSAAFLTSYLYYHAQVGHVRFTGTGWIRPVYFFILLTHTVLAVVIVPLIVGAVTLALRGRFERHKAWARWAWPLWMYVSVTGVVVYWMLYRL
jgi:uncharacterized membrane protein YozB (DUF420 family)